MAKPVTGLTVFGSNTSGTTTQLDNNFTACTTALNDYNTYKNYLSDTGAANAYVVTLPASTTGALSDGLQIQVKFSASNSGASVLNYNATGNANVVNQDGTALVSNQILANAILPLQYSNALTAWLVQTPIVLSTTLDVTFTFDGSGGTSGTVTIQLARLARGGWIKVPAFSANSGTGSIVATSNANIPAAYRPSTDIWINAVNGRNNGAGTTTPSMLRITTAGGLQILRDGAVTAYTNTSSCGISNDFAAGYVIS